MILGTGRLEKIHGWFVKNPYLSLTLVTIAALAPFLAKPFNMDDPCYVWAAQQIHLHPGNPYGFMVNWSGMDQPMWEVTQNPPLMSYFLAAAACLFGWSEAGLHLAGLLPAVAVVLGTYRLAKHFCGHPALAALVTLCAPGFLVSATTVMCDVIMLAGWTWAVVFWVEGLAQSRSGKLFAAGMLAAAALLSKYNGACLIPLLAAHGWLEKRSLGRWAFFLLIPVAAFFAFEWATFQLYGRGLFSAATVYAKTAQSFNQGSKVVILLNALAFIGGCFAAAYLGSLGIWRKRVWALFALGAGLLLGLGLMGGMLSKTYPWVTGGAVIPVIGQILFWSTGGLALLALALLEVWRKRDAGAGLVMLWIVGVFVFAAFCNWTINTRAILPMLPAVSILLARRLELAAVPAIMKWSLVASAALALLAAQTDFQQAETVRKKAELVCAKYATPSGRIWFQGHWGFQYYMQQSGALPLDLTRQEWKPGEVMVLPDQNANVFPLDAAKASRLEVLPMPVLPGFATMSLPAGAGFYSSRYGPLPFAFGRPPAEQLSVYVFK